MGNISFINTIRNWKPTPFIVKAIFVALVSLTGFIYRLEKRSVVVKIIKDLDKRIVSVEEFVNSLTHTERKNVLINGLSNIRNTVINHDEAFEVIDLTNNYVDSSRLIVLPRGTTINARLISHEKLNSFWYYLNEINKALNKETIEDPMFFSKGDQVLIRPVADHSSKNNIIESDLIVQGNRNVLMKHWFKEFKKFFNLESLFLKSIFIYSMIDLVFSLGNLITTRMKNSVFQAENCKDIRCICINCKKNSSNILMMECNHFVLCSACMMSLENKCPMCSQTSLHYITFKKV